MMRTFKKPSYAAQMGAAACVTVALYLMQQLFLPNNDAPLLRYVMALSLAAVFVRYALAGGTRDKADALAGAVVLAGIVLRMGYMLYTDCTVRFYDLYYDNACPGHAEYLVNLIVDHRLPQDYVGQRYQQPLFYLLGSAVSAFINALLGREDWHSLIDAAKTVSCMASCATLFLSDALCSACGVKGRGRALALAVVAFSPVFFLTGGRVNCDALASMFIVWELLVTLRWFRAPSLKNTVYAAVVFGCGVMTKISCGVIAPIMAVLMVVQLYRQRKNLRPLLGKLALFGAVSLPLGLWYNIRGYLKFGMPFGYVLELLPEGDLYTGGRSIFSRLFYIDFSNLLQTPYANTRSDFSAPVFFLKSALFGEFTYGIADAIPYILLVFAAGVAILAVVAMGKLLTARTVQPASVYLTTAAVLIYLSMLLFYLRYPFGCSMDFRYAAAMIIPGALLIGQWANHHEGRFLWGELLVGGFCAASCLMYLLI